MMRAAPNDARACLVTFGSSGDVHPMLALGQALRSRGRAVTLLSNPVFAPAAAAAGLDFIGVGEPRHYEDAVGHPKLWHPVDGLGVMWRYLLRPALAPTYDAIAALASNERLVLVASPVAMGARLAQERLGIPLVSVYTAATMLRSIEHPLTLAQWRVPRWLPRPAVRAAWALLDRVKLEPLVRPGLDAERARLGLPALQASVFGAWMHSPLAGVALFPAWFAAPAPDWPQQVQQGGFPLYDDPAATLSHSLQSFLDAGPAPVVFMPGTARQHADAFFQQAVRSCVAKGWRGVLLGQPGAQLAAQLPPSIHAAGYAPFAPLLGRARALVHHGGIGSSAQALRAGIPQLLVPQAYDQFDNAMRLEALGVAATIGWDATGLQSMPERLRQLLARPEVALACARWAARTEGRSARDLVVALVERFA
jgi:rhamnosyltransferase subunit B